MKNTKLILGTLALSAIAAGTILFPSSENTVSNYEAKELSFKQEDSESWNLAAEYYNKLRRNVNTGQIEDADYIEALQHVKNMQVNKTTSFSFVDEGPDNVGGRTRAISVHPDNDDYIIAGGVTGGLFKSMNGADNWSRVQGWDDATEVLSISSTAITNNGTIYVATGGAEFEGGLANENSGSQDGDGLWYSTDNGATFIQVVGTEDKDLTKVTADPSKSDVVYITGTSFGIKKMVNKGALQTLTGTSLSAGTSTQDVKVSPDGNVIIITSSGTIWSSQDAGATVNKVTGSSSSTLISGGSSRNESGISYEKNSSGKWNCYVARALSSGRIGGVWFSEDNGMNWTKIAEQYVDGNGGVSWDPVSTQGNYNLVIDAVKGFPNQCVLGGLNVYKWTKSANSSPASGTWEALSNWALPKGSQNYVHADIHRFTWNSKDQLIIGSDGGVQISRDSTLTSFYDANRGFNITQFYGISYGPDGAVIGGTQDNGTQYNDHSGFYSWLEHTQVNGGDGFESEISYLNEDAFIASIYYSAITRFNGVGNGSFVSNIPTNGAGLGSIGGVSSGTFYTPLRLFEDDNDINTQDSIEYIAKESKFTGETVNYTSLTFELPLEYTITQDLIVDYDTTFITADTVTATFDTLYPGDTLLKDGIARDTIMVPDYKQSLFTTHTDLGIYITRDMMRFSSPMEWWQINPVGYQAHSFEFSKDGNCLWIGTYGGIVYRVMGLDSAYSFEQADYSYRDSASYKLDISSINPGGSGIVTDISVDKDNPDKVIVVRGGTGSNHVYYTTNGTSASPTWTSIDGSGTNSLPNAPVFGVEIIANASTNETVIVGTEYGAFVTENINGNSTDWTPINNEIGLVPVFDVRQQWRARNQGVSNPYAIYLGTHGRGIWRSDNVLSTEEPTIETEKRDLTSVVVYPNPMETEGKIGFEINSSSDVNINIYDLQGKIVNRMSRTHLSKGKHVIPFDVQSLPSGTYIVTLETKSSSEVTKFIKF
jgi:hypothetical protein